MVRRAEEFIRANASQPFLIALCTHDPHPQEKTPEQRQTLKPPTPRTIDPLALRLPSYVPDRPDVRESFAEYYELVERDVDNFRPAALETLYDFFTTTTKYWRLSPYLELVSSQNALLALPGVEYVAYFPRGGANSIHLEAGTYRVQWLHPASGKYFDQPAISVSAGDREFIPPQEPQDDWVLHVLNSN
jgi:hypothetical protein